MIRRHIIIVDLVNKEINFMIIEDELLRKSKLNEKLDYIKECL